MTMTLPKSLTLKIEVSIDQDEVVEYLESEGKNPADITLDDMLSYIRTYANDFIDYNIINFADIYDDAGNKVAGDE